MPMISLSNSTKIWNNHWTPLRAVPSIISKLTKFKKIWKSTHLIQKNIKNILKWSWEAVIQITDYKNIYKTIESCYPLTLHGTTKLLKANWIITCLTISLLMTLLKLKKKSHLTPEKTHSLYFLEEANFPRFQFTPTTLEWPSRKKSFSLPKTSFAEDM